MQFDLKKIASDSKVPLAIVGGIAAGNLLHRLAPSKFNPLIAPLILAAAGLLLAVNVKKDFLKHGAYALSAFGGLKLLNTMSADPGTSGINGFGDLGFALPESIRAAIRKVIPSLNGDEDMQVIGTYEDFGTVDTDYQVLGPEDEFGDINGTYGVGADDLVLPPLNGSDIDVAGLDGRRNTGRFAAFKAKPNRSASMLPAKSVSPAVSTNRPAGPMMPGMRPAAGKGRMNLTCQVAGLGEVSVDIA